jgi:Mce-associated membrane protein
VAVADARTVDEVTLAADDQEALDRDLGEESSAEEPRSPRRSRYVWLAWLLSVLLVLALAGTVVVGVVLGGQRSRKADRSALLEAGRQTVVDFTTYKNQSWDADVQRVLADATGPFKDEFSTTARQLKAPVVANKATSQGDVLEAGVVSMDTDSAQVLVVADATITNTAAPDGQLRHYRIKLDMVRVGDAWLTAGLQAVG